MRRGLGPASRQAPRRQVESRCRPPRVLKVTAQAPAAPPGMGLHRPVGGSHAVLAQLGQGDGPRCDQQLGGPAGDAAGSRRR